MEFAMRPFSFAWFVLPAAVCAARPAFAQSLDPMDIRACTAIQNDAQRLACYDRVTHRDETAAAEQKLAEQRRAEQKQADEGVRKTGVFRQVKPETETAAPLPRSLLNSRWELDSDSKLGTFNLRSYQPVYVMPLFATSRQNSLPYSPNPANAVTDRQHLDNIEAKFQLSLKAKVWQGVFDDAGDLWVGYTQSSRWQVYNVPQSRPFRETDYEPEALLVFGTHYHVLGWNGRLFDIGIDHQSNGRSDPFSRSWNRIVADFGFERDGWMLRLRPWWRIPEARDDDNNPYIADYIGRGEMQLLHFWNDQEFNLTLRHSLRGGDKSRGSARLSWSFPLHGNLRGYVETFSGYGESLIDYNHAATYLGFGLSLLDW
jgi:phospholipase A1